MTGASLSLPRQVVQCQDFKSQSVCMSRCRLMHRSKHYPERCSKPGEASTSGREQQHDQLVRFADIGCGFGGLLVK